MERSICRSGCVHEAFPDIACATGEDLALVFDANVYRRFYRYNVSDTEEFKTCEKSAPAFADADTLESRLEANKKIIELTDTLVGFGETMKVEQQLMLKLAEGQQALKPVLEKLAGGDALGGGMSGEQFRGIDTTLTRIANELLTGRAESVSEIRTEIRLLARTIAALAESEN